MSVRALHSASSGMAASAFQLDTIANNLANAGTTAFKRSRANFEDLFYDQIKLPGAQDQQGKLTPTGIAVGLGARIASTQVDFKSGSLIQSSKPLDVAIVGEGFFEVQDGAESLYTRAGTFSLNENGELVMASADRGRLVEPTITIPPDATNITISSDGLVQYSQPGNTTLQQAGQLTLAKFVNPEGLIARGENLFAESDASGDPNPGVPNIDGRGQLRQFFLEASNVEPVRELVELIKTQRNFELNSQVIQAADQSLQLLANLRRF